MDLKAKQETKASREMQERTGYQESMESMETEVYRAEEGHLDGRDRKERQEQLDSLGTLVLLGQRAKEEI